MSPNEQWTDWALTQQFKAYDREPGTVTDTLEGLSHLPTDIATSVLKIEQLRKDMESIADDCRQWHSEWRQSVEARRKGRVALVAAVIAGSCAVLASIAAALISLAGGG